jgi:hypothetical protein
MVKLGVAQEVSQTLPADLPLAEVGVSVVA